MKLYLFVFLLVYFFISFILSSYRVWKQTGINPFVFTGTDTAHDYAGRMFKLVSALILVVVVIYAFVDSLYPYLLPIWYVERPEVRWAGWVLLHISLAWIALAQVQMGRSWRIGIDEKNKTELKTEGVFRWSRNPIFLGMVVSLAGFFLVIPNAVTLLILCLGMVILQFQIRLEEEYLQKVHGAAYMAYCQRTGRWL